MTRLDLSVYPPIFVDNVAASAFAYNTIRDEALRAQAEVDALRAALREYGECKADCNRMCSDDRPCDCGYIRLAEDK